MTASCTAPSNRHPAIASNPENENIAHHFDFEIRLLDETIPADFIAKVIMKPRITIITIAVDDLERSLKFYRDGLGLPTEGIVGTEFDYGAVAFFDLQAGVKLAIWPRKSLARDSGIPASPPSPTEFTLGHLVSSKVEVDGVMEQARKAGASIVKQAQDTFWGGYAGYFEDPDRHLWEIAWNPQMKIEDSA